MSEFSGDDSIVPSHSVVRCPWGESGDELMQAYHDREWGVPLHDDRRLFEFLILEGAQAGLSWSTVLRKRETYRDLFDGFDPDKVERYDQEKITALLGNPGIIRNRLKIHSAVANARSFLKIQDEFGSFDAYVWRFVDGAPIVNHWKNSSEVPVATAQSDNLSRDLKNRGCSFVGSTICYAFMQAVGMVNDHLVGCYRHAACREGVNCDGGK